MERQWARLLPTTAHACAALATKGRIAKWRRRAQQGQTERSARTADRLSERLEIAVASAKPATRETTARRWCSAPRPPMEKSAKTVAHRKEQLPRTIAPASVQMSTREQTVRPRKSAPQARTERSANTADLLPGRWGAAVASASPGLRVITARHPCSAPKPPTEKSVRTVDL